MAVKIAFKYLTFGRKSVHNFPLAFLMEVRAQ